MHACITQFEHAAGHRSTVLWAGAIGPLTALCSAATFTVPVLQCATAALRNLSHDEHSLPQMVQDQTPKALIQLCNSSSDDRIQGNIAIVLANLCRVTQHHAVVLQHHGVQLLINLASTCAFGPAKESAVEALAQLARSRICHGNILQSGGAIALVAICKDLQETSMTTQTLLAHATLALAW